MVNSKNERELAYLTTIDSITPMNADRLECAHIAGWHCVVGKGEFKAGDIAVYIEEDAQLPDVPPFSQMDFLRSKNFKIKPQRIRGELSQGLLVPISAFGWTVQNTHNPITFEQYPLVFTGDDDNYGRALTGDTRFLTQKLNITYADPGDNARKGAGPDKYKRMAQRHPSIFKRRWAKWLMRRAWGRRLMFLFFGKKKDKKSAWPAWVVKTDEERAQNMPWLAGNTEDWVMTEKIDGTSTTFTMRNHKNKKKRQLLVCSRNVVFDKPDKKCFYETNVYTEMALRYHMEETLNNILDYYEGELDFITIQGETFGATVQKRDYGMKDRDFLVFNVILGYKGGLVKRLNPFHGAAFVPKFGLKFVPVLGIAHGLPATIEEIVAMGDGKSVIDGGMREGIVFRDMNGEKSFKAVSNEFLLKYHN